MIRSSTSGAPSLFQLTKTAVLGTLDFVLCLDLWLWASSRARDHLRTLRLVGGRFPSVPNGTVDGGPFPLRSLSSSMNRTRNLRFILKGLPIPPVSRDHKRLPDKTRSGSDPSVTIEESPFKRVCVDSFSPSPCVSGQEDDGVPPLKRRLLEVTSVPNPHPPDVCFLRGHVPQPLPKPHRRPHSLSRVPTPPVFPDPHLSVLPDRDVVVMSLEERCLPVGDRTTPVVPESGLRVKLARTTVVRPLTVRPFSVRRGFRRLPSPRDVERTSRETRL